MRVPSHARPLLDREVSDRRRYEAARRAWSESKEAWKRALRESDAADVARLKEREQEQRARVLRYAPRRIVDVGERARERAVLGYLESERFGSAQVAVRRLMPLRRAARRPAQRQSRRSQRRARAQRRSQSSAAGSDGPAPPSGPGEGPRRCGGPHSSASKGRAA